MSHADHGGDCHLSCRHRTRRGSGSSGTMRPGVVAPAISHPGAATGEPPRAGPNAKAMQTSEQAP
jgi:hypothetical protein